MNGCQSIGVLLDGFHDGELGTFNRWRVQRHIAGCGACRDELASLAQLGGWVRVAVSDAPAAESWDAIERRLPLPGPVRKRPRVRSVPSRRHWLQPIGVAAAAAAFAGTFLVTTSDSGHLASLRAVSGVVRSVYANQRQVMVLEAESSRDSTIIWLMDEVGEQSPEVSESVDI
jgi:anti-sigma factor RsiW